MFTDFDPDGVTSDFRLAWASHYGVNGSKPKTIRKLLKITPKQSQSELFRQLGEANWTLDVVRQHQQCLTEPIKPLTAGAATLVRQQTQEDRVKAKRALAYVVGTTAVLVPLVYNNRHAQWRSLDGTFTAQTANLVLGNILRFAPLLVPIVTSAALIEIFNMDPAIANVLGGSVGDLVGGQAGLPAQTIASLVSSQSNSELLGVLSMVLVQAINATYIQVGGAPTQEASE
jgi:hypothetical protein